MTFEDLVEGAVFWGEEVVADADAMIAYAMKYDPWPFHVDAEAAKQTSFGVLSPARAILFRSGANQFIRYFGHLTWNGPSLADTNCTSSCYSPFVQAIASA